MVRGENSSGVSGLGSNLAGATLVKGTERLAKKKNEGACAVWSRKDRAKKENHGASVIDCQGRCARKKKEKHEVRAEEKEDK